MHDPCVHAARFPKTRRILGNRVNILSWRGPAGETYQSSEIMEERYLYIDVRYIKEGQRKKNHTQNILFGESHAPAN